MELITGVGSEAHITPLHDAMWHTGIWSKDCIIKAYNDMKAEIVSNNEIRIKDGICCIQGRSSCIKKGSYDNVNIDNGIQNSKRIDLIVLRYERNANTGVEKTFWKVIKGRSADEIPLKPSYTEAQIDDGATVSETPFYEVYIDGIQIKQIVRALPLIASSGHYPIEVYSGNAQMNETETKTFDEELLKNAPTGLMLVFSPYDSGPLNRNFQSFTVNKLLINEHSGSGHEFWLNDGDGWVERYLNISKGNIKGHSANRKGKWVLRKIYIV